MAGSLTVRQARLVLPDRTVVGDLVVEDGIITEIAPRATSAVGLQVDGRGCALLPGLVDTHVHLNAAEDIASVSRGATAGGVTSVLGVRTAETRAELKAELAAAAEITRVHLGLYIRATHDNLDEVQGAERAKGTWISEDVLRSEIVEEMFATNDRVLVVDATPPLLAPDEEELEPRQHPDLLPVQAIAAGTQRALDLARKHGARTHLLHVSTQEEIGLLGSGEPSAPSPATTAAGRPRDPLVTCAVRPPHLFLRGSAYERLGTRAVTSPPIRSPEHAQALWEALGTGQIPLVASGHLPIRSETKDRPYPKTHPGLPIVEWMLPLLLNRVHRGGCTLSDVARWTSEAPAAAFRLPRKGRLETGYDGDLVLVDLGLDRVVGDDAPVQSPCGWSPWKGLRLTGWPILTVLLGEVVYRDGEHLVEPRGRPL